VLEEAIRVFEPRINPRTLRIRPLLEEEKPETGQTAVIGLRIEADIVIQPASQDHLTMVTTLDLETGQCEFAAISHGS
jgi:predicted component of type VI protein secretion system